MGRGQGEGKSTRRIASFGSVFLGCLAFMGTAAQGQSIDYDPRRPAELKECDAHYYHGRTVEAKACYSRILAGTPDAILQAEAAWRSGDLQRANRRFRDAVGSSQRQTYGRSRWGRLFLETHQYGEAERLFREALELSPNDQYARLGLAHVYAEQFSGEAQAQLDAVLKDNDELTEAHLLVARMALEEGRLDEAHDALDRAAKFAEAQKQPPLEVYAGRAVLDLVRGRDSASMNKNPWVTRALAYNPHYGSVFEDLAHSEVMRRRYHEATPLLRQAIEVQPDLWSAHADLGANLLRDGEINEARQHLQLAYNGDPYSPTTVNTLRLLDRVDEVEVSESTLTLPATSGVEASNVDVLLRLNRKEGAALRPYVQELSRDAILTFAQRYGHRPRGPITVELYPDHDDFAVRVAALPGIGLLGVTFGSLVVMDSPSGRASGDFHWGTTLWHEMAHVFTLSMTDNRVPRWLSEGVSVFEEWRTGPTPGVAVTPDVITALRDDRFLPVSELDAGFIRPQYPNQVQVSYMQAGLVCLFIEQRWGFEQLPALVRQFSRDVSTSAAIEANFHMPAAEFDKQFQAFVRQRYANVLASYGEWRQTSSAARKAVEAQQWPTTIEAARRAIAIYPEALGPDSPYLLLARALDQSGQRSESIETLQQYRGAGGWDPSAMRQLADWLQAADRPRDAVEVLTSVNYADPLNATQHQALGEQLLTVGRAEDAVREFQVLLALNSHDAAAAHFGMARALRAAGDAAASRRHLLDALETAPHYKPAQALLLQMIEERRE
ncbi:MAG TPA: tetratricopeptide repeat protein [Povalibacter sp.]|nr:tetratricopeptide repeat protein [Povalibacter sp.]